MPQLFNITKNDDGTYTLNPSGVTDAIIALWKQKYNWPAQIQEKDGSGNPVFEEDGITPVMINNPLDYFEWWIATDVAPRTKQDLNDQYNTNTAAAAVIAAQESNPLGGM